MFQGCLSRPNLHFLFSPQTTFGGSGTFADVLSSSYSLGDYGDDASATSAQGGHASDMPPGPHHLLSAHGPGTNIMGAAAVSMQGASAAGFRHDDGGQDTSFDHPSSSSPFADVLPDTFHAEFITQPIDYPLGGHSPPLVEHGISHSGSGSPVPPPQGHSPSPVSAAAGGTSQQATASPISPSHTLPSFMDTYTSARPQSGFESNVPSSTASTTHPTTLEPRFTFKQDPSETSSSSSRSPSRSSFAQPSAAAVAASAASQAATSFSSLAAPSQAPPASFHSQSYPAPETQTAPSNFPTFLKKESYSPGPRPITPTYSGNLTSEFYQPPASTPFPQFVGGAAGGAGDFSALAQESQLHCEAGTLPVALQGALHGALQGASMTTGQVRGNFSRRQTGP